VEAAAAVVDPDKAVPTNLGGRYVGWWICRAHEYLEMVRDGEAIAIGDERWREITIAFLEALDAEWRDTWLRLCLLRAQEPFFRPNVRRLWWREYSGCPGSIPDVDPKEVYECVYNLATDLALREEAERLWDTAERKRYSEELDDYEDTKRRIAGGVRTTLGETPDLRSIPVWGESEKSVIKGLDSGGEGR